MVDLAVVTGSQNNVSRAMQSGTVTIGVDAGYVPEIIDSTANQADVAEKINSQYYLISPLHAFLKML